jgi:hypothetical protein
MKYIGITQKTANWLISHPNYFEALKADLDKIVSNKSLASGVISIGPLRISAYENQLILIWNNDYITGTDFEDWGFFKIQSPLGLFDEPGIINEVIEREIFVINQRLQNLVLPENMKHRSLGNNFHTCIAGRGEIAWHKSVGWYEDKVSNSKGSFHSIVCVGPCGDTGYDTIKRHISEASVVLPKFIEYCKIYFGEM